MEKLCTDCVHYTYCCGSRYCDRGRQIVKHSPVDGSPIYNKLPEYCNDERGGGLFSFLRCGPTGKYWEGK